jgi:hypothetical protein
MTFTRSRCVSWCFSSRAHVVCVFCPIAFLWLAVRRVDIIIIIIISCLSKFLIHFFHAVGVAIFSYSFWFWKVQIYNVLSIMVSFCFGKRGEQLFLMHYELHHPPFVYWDLQFFFISIVYISSSSSCCSLRTIHVHNECRERRNWFFGSFGWKELWELHPLQKT